MSIYHWLFHIISVYPMATSIFIKWHTHTHIYVCNVLLFDYPLHSYAHAVRDIEQAGCEILWHPESHTYILHPLFSTIPTYTWYVRSGRSQYQHSILENTQLLVVKVGMVYLRKSVPSDHHALPKSFGFSPNCYREVWKKYSQYLAILTHHHIISMGDLQDPKMEVLVT